MKKWLLLLLILCGASLCVAQGVRYDLPPVISPRGLPIPNIQVSLCPGTAVISGSTCGTTVQAFTDQSLNTACTSGLPVTPPNLQAPQGVGVCSATGDSLGNVGFWLSPGSYIYCLNGPSITGKCYNLTVPLGTTAGGTATVSTIAPCSQGTVQYVDAANTCARSGSDAGAWINAAAAALPASGGIVDACGLNVASPAVIVTAITIPAKVRLRICGNLSISAAGGITLADGGAGLEGVGYPNVTAGITCTAVTAGNGCVTLAGNTATHRGFIVRDLQISTTTAGNTINIQDGTGQISLERLNLKPAGEGIHLIPGVNGGDLLRIESIVVTGATNFGINLDASTGTGWAVVQITNSYVFNTGGVTPIGMVFGNEDVDLQSSGADSSTTAIQFNGASGRLFNPHCESNTGAAINIVGSGDYLIDGFVGFGNASTLTVNASNANTTVINPRTQSTTGTNDFVYTSANHNLIIGGALLSKAISVAAGVPVMQCIQGKCALLNGTTAQKAETGADATLLSYTPPSAAGQYRVCISMAVSAQNTATLGWTATWTDSNGSAQAPTNLALNQTGVAAPALTFTAATNGVYFACQNVDVNNSGTAIVVKTTFTGTSIAYKASAGVERLQ